MDILKENILQFIKSHFKDAPMKEIQHEVAKVLKMTHSTVYNKLSGRNDFSLMEFLQLAKSFDFSVDKFISSYKAKESRPVFFYADGLELKPSSFMTYFEKVMENVIQARASSSETKATFVCLQPHVFHLLQYPYLLYLKLYTYNLVNWRMGSVEKYDPVSFLKDEKTQGLIKKLNHAYQSIPISEMVGHNFIHPLCSQLDYLVKTRIIQDQEQLKQIKVDMFNFLGGLEEIAAKGYRVNSLGKESALDMYINKFIHVSNIILIESGDGDLLTIQCDVPDVLKTYDPVFINHFKHWLNSNREYAIVISKSGGLERREFFDRNIKHVNMVMEYLEKSFTYM